MADHKTTRSATGEQQPGGSPPPAVTRSVGAGARRRWLRFGPGLALALGAVLLLWPMLRGDFGADTPRIERSRLSEIPPPPAAPELGWLLEQKEALGLKPPQVDRLGRLRTRWDRATQALREALELASAQFTQEMRARQTPRVNVGALRVNAVPVTDLSRQLAEARRVYWSEAAPVLTRSQRRQAEAAWTRRLGIRSGSPLGP
jgi:hypothetical protein